MSASGPRTLHGLRPPPPGRQAESQFHYFVLLIVIKRPQNVLASDSITLRSALIRNEIIFSKGNETSP